MKTQKSVAFLYTNGEWIKKEIRETISSTISSIKFNKIIKYLGSILINQAKVLCNKTFKSLKTNLPCSVISSINIVKNISDSIWSLTKFQHNSSQILKGQFFQLHLKTKITQNNLKQFWIRKKNHVRLHHSWPWIVQQSYSKKKKTETKYTSKIKTKE